VLVVRQSYYFSHKTSSLVLTYACSVALNNFSCLKQENPYFRIVVKVKIRLPVILRYS
jgi:hypothetical protein